MPPRLGCAAPRRLGEAVTRSSRISSAPQSIVSTWRVSSSIYSNVVDARVPSTRAGYATTAAPPAVSGLRLPDDYVPPTQPLSARPPEARKSQLLRTYTQLLRTTPLVLIFQHNNLTSVEWAALRRELNGVLRAVPAPTSGPADMASGIQMQVIRTRIFDVALKVVEFFDPASVPAVKTPKGVRPSKKAYKHDLSAAALAAVKAATDNNTADSTVSSSTYAELQPLLVGPLAVLNFPTVSPAHLAAALSVLCPQAPAFPAPPRKKNPGYYDQSCQSALQKLLLIGGRIEGKVFDTAGVRWVGGIEGGLDSLRAQLVYLLQSAGMGLTSALEGAGKSLWLTVEGRRTMLEEEEEEGKPAAGEEAEGGDKKE